MNLFDSNSTRTVWIMLRRVTEKRRKKTELAIFHNLRIETIERGRFINFPAFIFHSRSPAQRDRFYKFPASGQGRGQFRAVVISFTSKARSSANCAKSTDGKGKSGGWREETNEGENSLQNATNRNQTGDWRERQRRKSKTGSRILIRRNCVNWIPVIP